MPTFHELNLLSTEEARKYFLSCCGSVRWAENMVGCRPFWNVEVVRNAAGTIWQYLSPEDRREALRSRTTWTEETLPEPLLEELNLYEKKFGYRFVAGPQVSGPEKIQAEVRRRFEHNLGTEFEIAVGEEAGYMFREVEKRITG